MTTVDFYDKEQVDDLLDVKANAADVYDKAAIDAKNIGAPDDAESSTGSLWARIKNAVARIISLETADTNNVKKTGTSTVTGTLEVPTTPPTPTSVVNSVYVNDATAGVNNIVHKTGNETINGDKVLNGLITSTWLIRRSNVNITVPPSNYTQITGIEITAGSNNDVIGAIRWVASPTGISWCNIDVRNSDGTLKTVEIARGDTV